MITTPTLRHQRPVYARCPACELVTASLWEVREAGRAAGWPVLVGCGYCAHEHRVERDQAYRLGALVRHEACGTTVACPPEAHLVRCHGRGPDSGACGDLFAGPAARAPLAPRAPAAPTLAARALAARTLAARTLATQALAVPRPAAPRPAASRPAPPLLAGRAARRQSDGAAVRRSEVVADLGGAFWLSRTRACAATGRAQALRNDRSDISAEKA